MLQHLLARSRYLIIIAVAGSFLAAITLVIAALTYFLSQKPKKDKSAKSDESKGS